MIRSRLNVLALAAVSALALAACVSAGPARAEKVQIDPSFNTVQCPTCSGAAALGSLANASPAAASEGSTTTPLSLDLNRSLRVNCVTGCSGGGGNSTLANASPAAATEGSTTTPLSLDLSRNLRVVFSNTSITANLGTLNGAATAANQATEISSLSTVATNTTSLGTAIGSKAGGAAGTNSSLAGGVYVTTPPTLTNGQQASLPLDVNGNLKVNVAAGGAGGGAVTVASGADVVEGATSDTSSSNTIFGALLAIKANSGSAIPAGSATIGNVGLVAGSAVVGKFGIDQTTPGTTNAVSVTNTSFATTMVDGGSVTIGTKADAATCATTNTLISCARQLHTDLTGSIPAGSAIIGQVGIDQTTPGTTNKVVAVGAAAANATASGNPVQVGGVYNTAVTAATTGQAMPMALDTYGQVAEAPYGPMMTALTAASGNVANASAAATLAAAAGKTTYITGFQCTAGGSTAASVANLTVAGVITGTMTYTFVFPAGVTTLATPVNVTFSRPVPASTTNTAIVVTLPAGGTGNTNASCNAQGFRL